MIGKIHGDRRLTHEFVLVAQCVWYWYELEEAAPLLEDSLRVWKDYQTAAGNYPVPFKRLKWLNFKKHDANWDLWHSAKDFWYLNHFLLGQIFQRQSKKRKAVEAFQQFLTYEPDFELDLTKCMDRHSAFIYLKSDIPDARAAKAAIAQICGEDPSSNDFPNN